MRKGKLDRYENLIDYQTTLLAERDLDKKVSLPSTHITWGSFLDEAYRYEPKQENKIEIPVINYDEKQLISMDVDKISAEYQKYFIIFPAKSTLIHPETLYQISVIMEHYIRF